MGRVRPEGTTDYVGGIAQASPDCISGFLVQASPDCVDFNPWLEPLVQKVFCTG